MPDFGSTSTKLTCFNDILTYQLSSTKVSQFPFFFTQAGRSVATSNYRKVVHRDSGLSMSSSSSDISVLFALFSFPIVVESGLICQSIYRALCPLFQLIACALVIYRRISDGVLILLRGYSAHAINTMRSYSIRYRYLGFRLAVVVVEL